MPIVVNPGFVWPPETEPAVSPDGRITAIVDPAHAGVLLRADFDDSVPDTPAVPEKVLRRNVLRNPSFESDTNNLFIDLNWTATNPVVPDALFGSRVLNLEMTSNQTGNRFRFMGQYVNPDAIEVGKWVAASVSIRVLSGSPYLRMRMNYTGGDPYGAMVDGSDGGWKRLTVTAQITSGTTKIAPSPYAYNDADMTQGPRLGTVVQQDGVMASVGDTEAEALAAVDTYFDGDTAASDGKRFRWVGTPHGSNSEEYTPAIPVIPGHDATTARVRFERQDGTVVRSGNPAWAPGGYAHAYDHEATLGGGTLWRAVPIHFDGTEGTPSEYVGAVIPGLSDGWAWLKPVTDPDKAMLLKVEPPDLSYDGRVDTTSIAGAPRPAATWDVLEGFTTQLRSLVREKPVADQLMTLLDEGPVLAQFPACAGLPDFYFIRGKVDLEHVHWDGYPWRRYQWDVISIDRPDTTDSPLRIPDLSYDTVERDWTTYDQLAATVTSYNKLLEP